MWTFNNGRVFPVHDVWTHCPDSARNINKHQIPH